jgi:ABC-type antimicrobial peptide transport system permease subunit
VVCLILGAFQLVVTVSANISDSMWELGVLRSMGCTRMQITSVIVYELIATTLAAITLGYVCGIIVSVLSIAIFHIIVELPMKVQLPWGTLIMIFIFAIFSMLAGAKYGTSVLFKKNIAGILKGC